MSSQRTLGLIGGVTWLSTLEYYRVLNEEVSRRLGGVHSAKLILASLDFHEIRSRSAQGDEAAVRSLYVDAAQRLERAGAEALLLCANTAHRRAAEVQASIDIPLLHIGDAIGRAARSANATRVALLGTCATMEEAFLRDHLQQRFGLEITIPSPADRQTLDRLIYEEMARGQFLAEAIRFATRIVNELADEGAQVALLACTELPILLRGAELACPTLDTGRAHALAAVDFSLGSSL